MKARINFMPDWSKTELWNNILKASIRGHTKHFRSDINKVCRKTENLEDSFAIIAAEASDQVEFWQAIRETAIYEAKIVRGEIKL